MADYVNEDWRDKLAAQERHEQLAASVRIAIGELCQAAENTDELDTAEKIYGITELLETQLKDGEVAYTHTETSGA